VQYELTIDPELESLCPALSADELRLLEESIESEGCRDEIVIWANHDKTVIDGHNRYRICKRLKLPYKTKSLAFVSKDEVKLWMLRNQMGRRNLSESQRAMMASRLTTISHGGDRKTDQAANLPLETQAEIAEKFGVSERSVRSAKTVEKHGAPELQQAVTNGEVSVSAAAEVAKKPKAEQKKIVAKGPEAVTAAAKKSKADKKAAPTAEPKDYGKCPNCAGTKWTEDIECGVVCSKCSHPHGEPAGEVDDQRKTDARSKTIKTAEALMRAFDDLNLLASHPKEHANAIATCKILLKTARDWR
jgi:hypothetical protein